jgi:tRNA modification GTPase
VEYDGREKEGVFLVSAKTGAGIDALKEAILRAAGFDVHAENAYMARARHVEALNEALRHIERAAGRLEQTELLAEELVLAHRALGSIIGNFSTEDLLGEIFSSFCIGK